MNKLHINLIKEKYGKVREKCKERYIEDLKNEIKRNARDDRNFIK